MIAPGAGVALVSLFDVDGTLLIDQTAELARTLCDEGAASVLVAGTAGEFWSLSDDERVALVVSVRLAIPNVPIFGHAGGVGAERAAQLTKRLVDAGANAILALPVGIDDLFAYYGALIDAAADTPVLAYHLPRRGTPIPVEDLNDMGVSAIKDSSGDGMRLAQEILSLDFETYTGAPPLLGVARQFGGAGSITGVANVRPEWSALAWAGDEDALVNVSKLHIKTSQTFPVELKRAVAARWGVPHFSRADDWKT